MTYQRYEDFIAEIEKHGGTVMRWDFTNQPGWIDGGIRMVYRDKTGKKKSIDFYDLLPYTEAEKDTIFDNALVIN